MTLGSYLADLGETIEATRAAGLDGPIEAAIDAIASSGLSLTVELSVQWLGDSSRSLAQRQAALGVLAAKVEKVVQIPGILKVERKEVNYAAQTGISTFGRLYTCTGKSAHPGVAQVIGKVVSDRVIQ